MYLGDDLGALVESIINGTEYVSKGKVKMSTGVDVLPDFKKDTSDRNRTSPFAFTGNKFEFRALGSALNIACPNIMLNTMVAEELSEFYDELKDASDLDAAVKALIKRHLQSIRLLSSTATTTLLSGLKRQRREVFLTSSHFLMQLSITLIRRTLTSLQRIRFTQ